MKQRNFSATTMNIIEMKDYTKSKQMELPLTVREQEIHKLIEIANHSSKAAQTYSDYRETHLRYCRNNLIKALIHLNEELDGPDDSA